MPRLVALKQLHFRDRQQAYCTNRLHHTMSLADYLAKNYLTADSEKKSKKRKRKEKNGGLTIDDDDNFGWKNPADEDDEDAPMISKHSSHISMLRSC